MAVDRGRGFRHNSRMNDAGPVQEYLVLARKYRSRTFAELIGQDALVRTLTNAVAAGKLHHAYVLTGIRGTGKTSTARLLAMALNCENGPSVTWAEDDPAVQAIRAGQHPDVLEYDAASNRGVEDVQKLFEGVAYAPLQGRFKVYIIDEVHMLSSHAFNALLKTLEEPPPRVKFVFATTDAQKIPLTILSRCQRFDLKRVPVPTLQAHFAEILGKEGLRAEPEALQLVARAADGSVRDGLSLLDQAVALAHQGAIDAPLVRDMLGLAGEGEVVGLLQPLLAGDVTATLAAAEVLYGAGHDALATLQGLLAKVHLLTRLKLVPGLVDSPSLTPSEQRDLGPLAVATPLPTLNRTYQILVQGLAEVKAVEAPHEALAMVLVRAASLAPLPAQLGPVAAPTAAMATAPAQQPTAAPAAAVEKPAEAAVPVFGDWASVVTFVTNQKPAFAAALRQQVRCLSVALPVVVVQVEAGLYPAEALLRELRAVLAPVGLNVLVAEGLAANAAAPATLRETDEQAHQAATQAAAADPQVQALLSAFPGAVLEALEVDDDERLND